MASVRTRNNLRHARSIPRNGRRIVRSLPQVPHREGVNTMHDLRVIGVENGALVAAADDGERYRIPIDEVLQSKLRQTVPQWMERIVKGITEAHGASYEFRFDYGYRPVINYDEVTRVIEETTRELFGEEAVARLKPNMGGEDFSAFLQKAPGSFFYVGARNEEKGIIYPHHHPRFTIDEDALEMGVQMFVGATLKLLAEAE